MFKINGYYPIVRCACGREQVLRRAQVCVCGVTLRMRMPRKNKWTPHGSAPDSYDVKAQPYRFIEVVGWEQEK